MKTPPTVCQLLPPAAAKLLQQAARTPENPGANPKFERTKAIEEATRRIQLQHPQFFNEGATS